MASKMAKKSQGPHILIVEARFYPEIADALKAGAVQALEAAGATHETIAVPGALEIPGAIRLAATASAKKKLKRPFDGYVALGCVIRGETSHYDIVCNESARGLQELALRHCLAIGNGILTVENDDQAWARARADRKNKGGDVAMASLAMIALQRRFGVRPRDL